MPILKIFSSSVVCIISLLNMSNAFSLPTYEVSHYKQLSDDGNTNILYSLRCGLNDKTKCSLQSLAVTNEKAKNSCYIVYKTIFKNKALKLNNKNNYSIALHRKKCDDIITYTFTPQKIMTEFKDLDTKKVSVIDDRCEIFKASKAEGDFIGKTPLIPQIGFGDCKTFTFQMDE